MINAIFLKYIIAPLSSSFISEDYKKISKVINGLIMIGNVKNKLKTQFV